MRSDNPRPSLLVGALTVVIALGVCGVASAVMVPTMLGGVGAWPVLIAGCVMLVGALVALWIIQKRRDHTLR
jgi:peptidoglycan/LPS O-acetylase OafA/YrhL